MSSNNTIFFGDNRLQSHAPLPPTKSKRSISNTSLRSDSSTLRFSPNPNQPLNLLSFEALGIAHPSSGLINSGEPNTRSRSFYHPVIDDSPSIASSLSSSLHMQPDNPYASPMPLTPPETEDNILWNPNSQLPLNRPSAQKNNSAPAAFKTDQYMEDIFTKESSELNSGTEKSQQEVFIPTQNARNGPTPMNLSNGTPFPDDLSEEWLQSAILPIITALPLPKCPGDSVQLVSQTLPCPPSNSSASAVPKSAFTPIVQALQNRLQPGHSPYINIVHAVPPAFSLSSLPTSPPSTPHLLFAGDDYFSNTVFASAAVVPGYHQGETQSPLGQQGPAPIVPPFSVQVSVVERYLPPTSAQEYQSLFSKEGPSVILDRLKELSPNGGSLMLIYPTKSGAETFRDKYLSPILDPHLRQLAVVKGLSADVGNALGNIPSVSRMDEFDGMKSRLLDMCEAISARSQTSLSINSCRTNFTLAYAGTTSVQMDRSLWTEWYIQQETPRARDILNQHCRKGHRLPDSLMLNTVVQRQSSSQEVTGASLLREILDGVRNRQYSDGYEPTCGIELGVFVIRRSL